VAAASRPIRRGRECGVARSPDHRQCHIESRCGHAENSGACCYQEGRSRERSGDAAPTERRGEWVCDISGSVIEEECCTGGQAEEGDPGQVESAGEIRVARGGNECKHERESGTEQEREPWSCFRFVVEELPIHGHGAVT
jgi:hypothetical protein